MDYKRFLERAAKRRRQVMQLHIAGLSLTAIGKRMKISRQRVRQILDNGAHK